MPFARNKAVELAKYDWIAILDHDDLWVRNKLEIQNYEIIQNPDGLNRNERNSYTTEHEIKQILIGAQ